MNAEVQTKTVQELTPNLHYAAGAKDMREQNERLKAALRPFAVYGRTGSRDIEVAAAIKALETT